MSFQNRLIDLEKIPEGQRDYLRHVASQFNAFVSDVEDMQKEWQKLAGETVEEQGHSQQFVQFGRKVFKWLNHKWRFNMTLVSIQLACLGVILKNVLGISPEMIQRLMEAILKIIEKVAGA